MGRGVGWVGERGRVAEDAVWTEEGVSLENGWEVEMGWHESGEIRVVEGLGEV